MPLTGLVSIHNTPKPGLDPSCVWRARDVRVFMSVWWKHGIPHQGIFSISGNLIIFSFSLSQSTLEPQRLAWHPPPRITTNRHHFRLRQEHTRPGCVLSRENVWQIPAKRLFALLRTIVTWACNTPSVFRYMHGLLRALLLSANKLEVKQKTKQSNPGYPFDRRQLVELERTKQAMIHIRAGHICLKCYDRWGEKLSKRPWWGLKMITFTRTVPSMEFQRICVNLAATQKSRNDMACFVKKVSRTKAIFKPPIKSHFYAQRKTCS